MTGFSFNAARFQPRYGSDSAGLPAGRHKVVIENGVMTPVKDKPSNSYLALYLKCIEGLANGGTQVDRLNVHNSDATAVRIANEQLSAYCAAVNRPGFGDVAELYNIPFYIETMPQIDNPRFSNVIKLFDINGNEIGKSAAPAQIGQPQAPPQGFGPGPSAGGWAPQTTAPAPQPPQQQFAPQPEPQQQWGQQPQAQPVAAPWSPAPGGAAPSWGAR